MATHEQQYAVLGAWCGQQNIGCLCPPQDAPPKVINRFWEELHYYQVGELDALIEQLEGREHISSSKDSALKRLRPWVEKIFRSVTDPDFVARDRRRGQLRSERKAQSSSLQSDETSDEGNTMSNDNEVAEKSKKPASKKEVPAIGGVGLADIAQKMKVDPADLRRALRSSKIKKPAGSWNWPKGHADLKAVEKLASSLK